MPQSANRRQFLKSAAVASSALLIARFSHAQGPVVTADDPTAVALGYVADHTQVDTAKWAKRRVPMAPVNSAPVAPFIRPLMTSTAPARFLPASECMRRAGVTAGCRSRFFALRHLSWEPHDLPAQGAGPVGHLLNVSRADFAATPQDGSAQVQPLDRHIGVHHRG